MFGSSREADRISEPRPSETREGGHKVAIGRRYRGRGAVPTFIETIESGSTSSRGFAVVRHPHPDHVADPKTFIVY